MNDDDLELIGVGFFLVLYRLDQLDEALYETRRVLRRLINMEEQNMADLSQITADVAANTDAVGSAIALIQNIKAELDAAGTDPAALAALSASLESNTAALADAVVANTPADTGGGATPPPVEAPPGGDLPPSDGAPTEGGI